MADDIVYKNPRAKLLFPQQNQPDAMDQVSQPSSGAMALNHPAMRLRPASAAPLLPAPLAQTPVAATVPDPTSNEPPLERFGRQAAGAVKSVVNAPALQPAISAAKFLFNPIGETAKVAAPIVEGATNAAPMELATPFSGQRRPVQPVATPAASLPPGGDLSGIRSSAMNKISPSSPLFPGPAVVSKTMPQPFTTATPTASIPAPQESPTIPASQTKSPSLFAGGLMRGIAQDVADRAGSSLGDPYAQARRDMVAGFKSPADRAIAQAAQQEQDRTNQQRSLLGAEYEGKRGVAEAQGKSALGVEQEKTKGAIGAAAERSKGEIAQREAARIYQKDRDDQKFQGQKQLLNEHIQAKEVGDAQKIFTTEWQNAEKLLSKDNKDPVTAFARMVALRKTNAPGFTAEHVSRMAQVFSEVAKAIAPQIKDASKLEQLKAALYENDGNVEAPAVLQIIQTAKK